MPFHQQRFDANRKKFYEQFPNTRGKGGRSSRSRGHTARPQANANANAVTPPATSTTTPKPKYISGEDGIPMVLNKLGNYVVDQKRYKTLITNVVKSIPEATSSTSQATPAGASGNLGSAAPNVDLAAAIRSALRRRSEAGTGPP